MNRRDTVIMFIAGGLANLVGIWVWEWYRKNGRKLLP